MGRLDELGVKYSAFDLSAIGSLASTEYRIQFDRPPRKIRQKEQFGWFMVSSYPFHFKDVLDRLISLFMGIPENHRKETMQAAMTFEKGPLTYLEPDGSSVSTIKRKRKRRRRIGEEGEELPENENAELAEEAVETDAEEQEVEAAAVEETVDDAAEVEEAVSEEAEEEDSAEVEAAAEEEESTEEETEEEEK